MLVSRAEAARRAEFSITTMENVARGFFSQINQALRLWELQLPSTSLPDPLRTGPERAAALLTLLCPRAILG